jgi:hypothetical protein
VHTDVGRELHVMYSVKTWVILLRSLWKMQLSCMMGLIKATTLCLGKFYVRFTFIASTSDTTDLDSTVSMLQYY